MSIGKQLPVLGIPLVVLSEQSLPNFVIPRFAKQLGLSCAADLHDVKIIDGGDIIGDFPKGFHITATVDTQ